MLERVAQLIILLVDDGLTNPPKRRNENDAVAYGYAERKDRVVCSIVKVKICNKNDGYDRGEHARRRQQLLPVAVYDQITEERAANTKYH